ncbi:restriction endonuclease [Salinivibrio proteolyticus]|uniref:Restriction endonuclease n=1 Tax=Salinivibrio proteolyticus TaxID=334715 RepID=A0ABY7L9V9_9GAMM|nr:restriction endonuclease [Salinivibrio proteolyticus]WBA13858.1 restriction endonuclease [Salinivibrio proteolyticus]
MSQIILVRSPEELISESLAGYGWGCIDMSSFSEFSDLMQYVEDENIDIGRQRNQIYRFFHAKPGDVVVVPISRAIVIGVVREGKVHKENGGYGSNCINVDYFKDENGEPIKIPRAQLSERLESRLKIRMTIAPLNEFADEIDEYVRELKDNKKVCFDSIFQQKKDAQVAEFKRGLLSRLRNGETTLESGGYGLEKLVKELMELEGYSAQIAAKNKTSDISDVDIEASRTDPVSSNRVFIQVKHHRGETDGLGIRQLAAIDEDEHVDKWLITTADVADETLEFATTASVSVMDGSKLVDWIYDRIDELSVSSKERLGIGVLPQIIAS